MKTSSRSGSAAIATMVLSVLSLCSIATITGTVRSEDGTNGSPGDINVNRDCTGPDLVITSLVTKDNNKKYRVYVKNIGDAPAVMEYPKIAGWQAYLSKNGISKDIRVLGNNFSGTLGVGQTTSASAAVSVDLASYPPYPILIVELYVLSSVGECNSSNNTFHFSFQQ